MWPLQALKDDALINKIIKEGIHLQAEIKATINTPPNERVKDPQILWNSFKAFIKAMTKKEHKNENYRIQSKIENLKANIKANMNSQEEADRTKTREEVAFLESKLSHLHKKLMKGRRNELKVQIINHGKKPGGIWSTINKEKKPRDLIPRLRIPNTDPPLYERSSIRMVELAHNYHKNLQCSGTEQEHIGNREETISKALEHLPETQHLKDPERMVLAEKVRAAHINEALKISKNRTTISLDGCPYKLWNP